LAENPYRSLGDTAIKFSAKTGQSFNLYIDFYKNYQHNLLINHQHRQRNL